MTKATEIKGGAFEYIPGLLDVQFAHERFDHIQLLIRAATDQTVETPIYEDWSRGESVTSDPQLTVLTCTMSSVFCPFRSFLCWLEAVTTGVQKCAFFWDAEGPEGRMEWSGCHFKDIGHLTITWSESEEHAFRVMLSRRQMIGAFYGALRAFVESPDYHPLRYERLSTGDAVVLVLHDVASQRELMDRLIPLPAVRAAQVMELLADLAFRRAINLADCAVSPVSWNEALQGSAALEITPYVEGDDGSRSYISADWDCWSPERRTTALTEVFEGTAAGGLFGDNLREMRSAAVESWLADTP